MIPLLIIKKILLFLAPLILFYLLRKMGKGQQIGRKSHLPDFDKQSFPFSNEKRKEKIVEGEIVDN